MPVPEWLANDPLYKVLGLIGRNEKSLTPKKLLGYETLLHCPEVNRRVAADATDLDRARAAEAAILEAIGRIDDSTERRIAEAVLCTTEPFIGKRVGVRKQRLVEEGISDETFGDTRYKPLEWIVTYLGAEWDNSVLPPNLPPAARGLPEDVVHVFHGLTGAAANLHYAALACAFIYRTDALLKREGTDSHRNPTQPIEEPGFFSSHLYMAIGYLEHERRSLEASFPQWKTAYLSLSQQRTLWFMMNTIDQLGPLRAVERVDLGHYASSMQSGETVSDDQALHLVNLFQRVWTPWFDANVPVGDTSETSSVEIIAAKSATILGIVKSAVGVNRSLEYGKLFEYYGLLERYYFDVIEATVDDVPLPKYIEHYLNSATNALATSSIVWFNSDVNRSKQGWQRTRLVAPKQEDA